MPIEELTESEVVQRCAACEAHHRLPLAAITAAAELSEAADARALALPPCAGCGAREFVLRSSEDERARKDPGSFAHLHQLLVDALGERRFPRGEAKTSAQSDGARDPALGLDAELARWFPNGLRLDADAPPLSGEVGGEAS